MVKLKQNRLSSQVQGLFDPLASPPLAMAGHGSNPCTQMPSTTTRTAMPTIASKSPWRWASISHHPNLWKKSVGVAPNHRNRGWSIFWKQTQRLHCTHNLRNFLREHEPSVIPNNNSPSHHASSNYIVGTNPSCICRAFGEDAQIVVQSLTRQDRSYLPMTIHYLMLMLIAKKAVWYEFRHLSRGGMNV